MANIINITDARSRRAARTEKARLLSIDEIEWNLLNLVHSLSPEEFAAMERFAESLGNLADYHRGSEVACA